MSCTYLVTGATGNTGKTIVSILLSHGHKVHAIVRNPSSRAAQAIASSGATLFQGDFASPSSLSSAASGCNGLFLITIPGPDAVTFVQNALTAFLGCCAPDPTVVLMGSIFQDDATTALVQSPNSGLPDKPPHEFVKGYWSMTDAVERAVKESRFPHWTILRPAWYMSNYLDFAVRPIHWPALAPEKKLVAGVLPATPFEMIDPSDIGTFAAYALMEKGEPRWEHKCLALASELLTLEEKARIMSHVSRIEVKAVHLQEDEAARFAEEDFVGYLHFWQRMTAPKVNMDEMRAYGFKLGSFEEYLTRNKERLLQALNDDSVAQRGLSSKDILEGAGQHGH